MRVTIHQPEHLPWLGLFDKVRQVDLFVVLDTVQYRKGYFQNRNRVRRGAGWMWLTLPVRQPVRAAICEILVDRQAPARRDYLNRLRQEYRQAPYLHDVLPGVTDVLASREERLAVLNQRLLEFAMDRLGITTPVVSASQLEVPSVAGSDLVLALCREVGANQYLSGMSGRDYLVPEDFAAAGVQVTYQDFAHPVYEQVQGGFWPCMSVLDLLLNHGPRAEAVFAPGGAPTVDPFVREAPRGAGRPGSAG